MRELFGAASIAAISLALAAAIPAAAGTVDPQQAGAAARDADTQTAAEDSAKLIHEARRRGRKAKHKAQAKASPPEGPFRLVVSTAKQQVALYGRDGFIDKAPVATGMPAHPTPKGVFTVISKDKWHRSNIYSGAPMPFMQRLTWSGVALHAGPLPGYPASHGCIRLPYDFAVRLWRTTKVGARVIVTREPAAPADISHPKLTALKTPKLKPLLVADASAKSNPTLIAAYAAGLPSADRADEITRGMIEALAIINEPHGEGPVAVFVSLKQKRVFVRQGFVALFDMPVEITEPEQPIGTHVYTAMELQDDDTMHWSVISVPSGYRHVRSGKKNSGYERLDPSNANEALDRIILPRQALTRISQLLIPGSTLIVSDNAMSDDVNEYSEFIVLTR